MSMKILLSESQYQKLMVELNHHPKNHDIEQRNHRMGLLENGVSVVVDWFPPKTIKVGSSLMRTVGPRMSKIFGKYILTEDEKSIINEKIDKIYTYDFPPNESFSILIHDFNLDTPNVYRNKIKYPDGNSGMKLKTEFEDIFKTRKLSTPVISFTQYELTDKKNPNSELSDKHRSNCMVMVIEDNTAVTIFLSTMRQWKEQKQKTPSGYMIDHYVEIDEIGEYAKRMGSVDEITYSPLKISKEVKESWILEWLKK